MFAILKTYREILAKGGSAVDAAIAALFIEGVVHPHATGIGGSCMFTIYDNVCKEVKTITARGAAPGAANESTVAKIANPVTERGKTVCVPGLVRGCWWAHEDYGKLPWADLIQPAARLCKEGFPLCPYLESVMFLQEDRTTDDEELNVMSKSTGFIVLNDEMHTFQSPNECRRSDVPICHSIYCTRKNCQFHQWLNDCNGQKSKRVFCIGAAGEFKVLLASALVTLRHLFCGEPIAKAIFLLKRLLQPLYPSHY
ncbi:hypothetical protein FQR65_LT18465 [Abscondita terminalis]|nr:hypothetical protein FQR65_LT18465 [Abscondita terminalis]